MNVYWAVYEYDNRNFSTLNYYEPERLTYHFKDYSEEYKGFTNCPATHDYFQNTFALRFPFDYNLKFDHNTQKVSSDYYDQAFFDGYVTLRNSRYNIFSLNIHYLFVCEESLNISLTGVNFSTNDFVEKTYLIPGRFNIGKWYRNLDCGFILNNNHKELNIEKGKEYCYVNFQTDEKVNLKKFYLTDKIKKMISGEIIGMKNYKKEKSYSLEHSYEMFEKSQLRKYMLKEIRKNTLE